MTDESRYYHLSDFTDDAIIKNRKKNTYIPMAFFENPYYRKHLNNNARVMFGIFNDLNRLNQDEQGLYYIRITWQEIERKMGKIKPYETKRAFKKLQQIGAIKSSLKESGQIYVNPEFVPRFED